MNKNLVDKLLTNCDLTDAELIELICTDAYDNILAESADKVRKKHYGNKIYIRGLIEFTNYCKNNCFYCGLRRDNKKAERYRLSKEDILSCCKAGYALGFRTFVLQGGEDPFFTDKVLCDIVFDIKNSFPDCAVTLSVGEKSRESYKAYKNAGADRYLLRHETACSEHYSKLHPDDMSFENRKRCLFDLKEIGFQVGAGFMVGSPYQKTENIIKDIRFLQQLQPDMIGIGPFLTQSETPFAHFQNGSLDLSIRLLSILRLLFPKVLLPATTALATLDENGRERALLAGANVVMPNLSPLQSRKKYAIYDNKLSIGGESAEKLDELCEKVKHLGYEIVCDRGDAETIKGVR